MLNKAFAMALAITLVGVAAACSSSDSPSQPTATCDAAKQSACYSRQMICVPGNSDTKCETCPAGSYASQAGACETLGTPKLQHQFQTWTIPPYTEYRGKCQSWTLNNAEPLYVNAVELEQNEESHHSIWTFVPDDHFAGPDGTWDCAERSYDEIKGALLGGVLLAQSTQAPHQVQKFREDAAVRIPPYSRVISDIHLLNATAKEVSGSLTLKIYDMNPNDVKVQLVPFQVDDRAINVLARAKTRLVNHCSLEKDFQANGTPFNPKIHYILPHTHGYGKRFYVKTLGGTRDGETILDVDQSAGYEAYGRAFDPPFDVTGAAGLTVGCEYENNTDQTLGWGWSDEMCQTLGYMESPVAFVGTISTATQGPADGAMQVFTGDCDVLATPWDFNRPGGPPR
ncbi:hypothetical protein LZC95_12055 [Pendulispora brunnea]|uniref:Copper type II ascorbate-dependent monooxygenase C-terminal domain-containing protein n=1 Tax=Pendulispora brunnea TaxID=2905690 RepID=A0ABZ2KHN2_9BACT